MTIQIKRFGEILTSRPEGREAALVLLSTDLRTQDLKIKANEVTLDFSGVLVMTPSWLSEFRQTLLERGIAKVNYGESDNASVTESIRFIELEAQANS